MSDANSESKTNGNANEIPEYLVEILEEAKEDFETRAEEQDTDTQELLSRVSDYQTNEHGHLRSFQGDRTPFSVLEDLWNLNFLSVERSEWHENHSPSYDRNEAAIQGILYSSLESFIYQHLREWINQGTLPARWAKTTKEIVRSE